jgi:hypothetical protein
MRRTPEHRDWSRKDAGQNRDGCRKWRRLPGTETIWHAEGDMHGVPLRSVAVRLRDERLAVYSPIRGLGTEAHRELMRIGRPGLLVAPNHYHNLGLTEYAAAYPEACIVSSALASARVQRKCRRPVGDESRLLSSSGWRRRPRVAERGSSAMASATSRGRPARRWGCYW